MRTSTNYSLNLVEGDDKVNPLVQDVPNYEKIDESMFDNKEHVIGEATELRSGTVHAITRINPDAAMFRFTATSKFTAGDTFTVDGVQVSALLVDGSTLPDGAYVIGSEVLCCLKGTLITVYCNRTTSSDSDKLGGHEPSYFATQENLDTTDAAVESHTNQISEINTHLSDYSLNKFNPFYSVNYGAMTDCLNVDLNNLTADANRQGYVFNTSINAPSNLSLGMCRNVYYHSKQNIIVSIIGVDTSGMPCIWLNRYNGKTWLGWYKINMVSV